MLTIGEGGGGEGLSKDLLGISDKISRESVVFQTIV